MKRLSIALAFLVSRAAAVSYPPPEIFVDPLKDSDLGKGKDDIDFFASEMVEYDTKEKIGEFVADEVPSGPFSIQLSAADYVAIHGGMQMETSSGSDTVGWMEKGDWVAYAVTLPNAGTYKVEISIASPIGDGAFELVNMGTKEVYGVVDKLSVTGDYEKWKKVSVDAELPAGPFQLQIRSLEYGWNIEWISLSAKSITPTAETSDSVLTKASKKKKSSKSSSTKSPTGAPTTSPTRSPSESPTSAPTPEKVENEKTSSKKKKTKYAPTGSPTAAPVTAAKPSPTKPRPTPTKAPVPAPKPRPVPTNAPVQSMKPNPKPTPPKPTPTKAPVPAIKPNPAPQSAPSAAPISLDEDEVELFSVKFDASDFSLKQGVELDVKMMEAGNWIAYPVRLPVNGRYAVKMRISSPKGTGAFQMMSYETQETFATYDDLPATGNWMTWRTVTQFVNLPRGNFDLQILALKPGWSLLWLSIEEMPTFTESEADPTGFVRAYEQMILDPEGYAMQFKGISVGGWMVQEPQMMLAEEVARSPGEFHHMLKGVVGEENHTKFKQAWLENFLSQQDIKELKSLGFNLVRVPMHYELFTLSIQDEPISGLTSWIGTGFQLLDNLLSWCEEEEMYVLLDLQAAPGGQGRDMSITDYNISRPSLWESQDNQYKTLILWQALAYRYSENPWIAGYELLSAVDWKFTNDTNVTCFEEDNAALKSFYLQAIDAIRAVDQNHMIVINGNCGGNHHGGLWPMDDENLVLGFQDDGEENFTEQLLLFANYSDAYDVPLFFKPGAYDDAWNAEAVELLENSEVSWSWWTWKDIESSASAFSISTTTLYDGLLDYLSSSMGNVGTNPTAYKAEDGVTALMSIANNTNLTKCTRNPLFLASLLGGGSSGCENAAPIYVDTTQPSRIASENYCILKQFGLTSDEIWLNRGDSVSYKIDVVSTGMYEFLFKVSSMDGSGGLQILSDGIFLSRIDTLPLTTRRDEWAYVYANVPLIKGPQEIEIVSTQEGWTMEWFQINIANN